MNEYKRWKHAAWALVFIVIGALTKGAQDDDDEDTESAEDADHDNAPALSKALRL